MQLIVVEIPVQVKLRPWVHPWVHPSTRPPQASQKKMHTSAATEVKTGSTLLPARVRVMLLLLLPILSFGDLTQTQQTTQLDVKQCLMLGYLSATPPFTPHNAVGFHHSAEFDVYAAVHKIIFETESF